MLHITEIKFKGNNITKPQIIFREMTLHSGDSLLQADLESELDFNKRRILNLQLFSSARYDVIQIDENNIEITFTVTELFFWIPKPEFTLADRNFNVWWKEQHANIERTNIGLQLTRVNFRGRSERIGGTAMIGYNKYFDIFYKIPYIDRHLKRGLGISATYSTGREVSYLTSMNKLNFYHNDEYPYQYFQTELTYTYRPAYAIIHELNLSYNHYAITQDLFDKNPDYLGGKKKLNYLELKFTVGFNNTDIRIYPLNGLDVKGSITKRGLGIDKDLNQFAIRTELSYYKKFSPHFSSSLILRGRLSFPDDQPYFNERALGFKNDYVRGYEYYVIDGSHYAVLRGNLRYRIIDRVIHQGIIGFMKYIPLRIYAKVYDDIGYVYSKNPGNSFLNNNILNGYGAGIDIIVSYYLKFRIEYSFNHLKQNGLFLHGNKE
jgi:outer membrane protein assembly factor BamA